jgi:MFS family permease
MTFMTGMGMIMADLDLRTVDRVLEDLVQREVLTSVEASAVHDGISEAATVLPDSSTVTIRRGMSMSRVIEAAGYLGAALVAASAVAYVAQKWESLDQVARLFILLGTGVVSAMAGALVITFAGGIAAIRKAENSARRRLASVLLSLGAGLFAVGAAQAVHAPSLDYRGPDPQLTTGALIALLLLAAVQLVAPSAVPELGMLGACVILADVLAVLTRPASAPDYWPDQPPPLAWWELTRPTLLIVLGLVWALLISRWLTLRVLAVAVGALVAFQGAVMMASDERSRTIGLVALGALAVLGIGLYLWEQLWPWLGLAVISVTALVFIAVIDTGGTVTAFLASGLVLLVGAGGAAWLRANQAARPQIK